MDIYKLKDEIDSDPLGRNYAGMTDQQIADSLNAEDRTRNRENMTGSEIMQSVDVAEYNGIPNDNYRNAVDIILSRDINDPFGVEADIFLAAFGASSTITALQAARVETVSRATEIGLPLVRVGHVTKARGL